MRLLRYTFTTSFLFIIALTFVFLSCTTNRQPESIKIGISKGMPAEYYGNYTKWLTAADSTIICVDLYHMPLDSALLLLEECDGLLLTGGPDVYPGRYSQEKDTVKCGAFDFKRDTLEWSLIRSAKALDMPVLGICRGLQIFNIYHGGSLYPDIPTDLDTIVTHRCKDTYDCFHSIRVSKESGLLEISGERRGIVNSNHHQGINRLGDGLLALARTEDGLIESIEYLDSESMPFFLGVQWHPERMDFQNPFSLSIAERFINEAQLFKTKK